jgi:hypothetical protein
MNQTDFQKESLRVTISLGLIAFFTALIFGIHQINIGENFLSELIKIMIYGFFVFSLIVLFLFILLTAARLKYKEPNMLDETIPIGEKSRRFFYDEGIELTYRGIVIGSVYYLSMKLVKIINLSNTAMNSIIWVIAFLAFYILIDFLMFKILKN